jgi:hypothetical protein
VLLSVTGVVAVVADGGLLPVALVGAGLLCALGAVVFLDRVRSEPLHPTTRLTALGRRLAAWFWHVWGVGLLLNAVRVVFDVGVPAVVEAGVGLLVAAAFLAMHPVPRPGGTTGLSAGTLVPCLPA